MTQERKQQVNEAMMKLPTEWRYYWCRACEMGGCGCMGCVNISGRSMQGLEIPITETEWEDWVRENPPIPKEIYYGTDTQNFYHEVSASRQDSEFYNKWISRKAEFPQKKTEGMRIQEFATKSPENAKLISEIVNGIKDGTLSPS